MTMRKVVIGGITHLYDDTKDCLDPDFAGYKQMAVITDGQMQAQRVTPLEGRTSNRKLVTGVEEVIMTPFGIRIVFANMIFRKGVLLDVNYGGYEDIKFDGPLIVDELSVLGSLEVGTTITAMGNITIGSGAAGVDYTLTFDGETNDGVITWMEDENYLTIPNINLVASTATVGQIYQNGISIFNTYGTGNFFFGPYSGNLNGLGHYNTGIGEFTLRNVTTNGDYNVALGRFALRKNTSGYRNMAIGYNALSANLTGSNNVAIGAFALWDNETGDANFGMGSYALNSNISGLENVGIGNSVLGANTTGSYNVGIGDSALAQIQNNNSRNIAIGHYSGRYIYNDSTALTDTNSSIFIGYHARSNADGDDNQIVIGDNAIGLGSNSVVLGNSSITKTRLYGDVVIGSGAAGTDYTLTFDGETNDGVIAWMEDEDYFDFLDEIKVSGGIRSDNNNPGINQVVTILDGDGVTTHTLTFENGILVTYATA